MVDKLWTHQGMKWVVVGGFGRGVILNPQFPHTLAVVTLAFYTNFYAGLLAKLTDLIQGFYPQSTEPITATTILNNYLVIEGVVYET